MPMKNPPHVGGFIRRNIIEAANLTVTAAAQALGVSRVSLSSLINEKAGLSAEMAMRLEKAFGVDMVLLMDMQTGYEIAQARKREKQIKVRPLFAASHAVTPDLESRD